MFYVGVNEEHFNDFVCPLSFLGNGKEMVYPT
jgi:hypothetical protein